MVSWLNTFFQSMPAIWAVIIISLICAVGLAIGKIRIFGVSLGVTYVFFFGILVGALGLTVDSQMLSYAESFGLILFVYILGLQVGPGFMSAFKQGGTKLNLLGVLLTLIGTFMALGIVWAGWVPLPDMMGVLCGSTTNTPAPRCGAADFQGIWRCGCQFNSGPRMRRDLSLGNGWRHHCPHHHARMAYAA